MKTGIRTGKGFLRSLVSLTGVLLALVIAAPLPATAQPGAAKSNAGILAGRLLHEDGKPVAASLVAFFDGEKGPPPDLASIRRVPQALTFSAADGGFAVPMQAGSYFIGSILRPASEGIGPPRPGERFLFVKNEAGELLPVEVKAGRTTDIGQVIGYVSSFSGTMQEACIVEGRVRSTTDGPVPAVFLLVKKHLGTPRPLYIAVSEEGSGAFRLQLPAGEPHFLVARESIDATRPAPGTLFGSHGAQTGSVAITKEVAPGLVGGSGRDYIQPGAMPIACQQGEVLGGVEIHLGIMPDPEKIREAMIKEQRGGLGTGGGPAGLPKGQVPVRPGQ